MALADTMYSSATVDANAQRVHIALPEDYTPPAAGLNYRATVPPLEIEELVHVSRIEAALAFARPNRLDRTTVDVGNAWLGIVTTDRAYLDACQALDDLGIEPEELGLRGSLLDPFGYTRDRRAERRLIAEYEHTLQVLRESPSPGNHALAVEIAALPQQVRGFGDVKRANCERVKRQEKALLDRFLKREHTRDDEPGSDAFGGASEREHL